MHKAHYVLMNIECDQETLDELEHAFKFNDAVLRHLIVAMREAVVAPSPMMKEEKAKSLTDRGERGERGDRANAVTAARLLRRRRKRLRPRPRQRHLETNRDARRAGANRLALDATLAQRGDLRYTPAGIPALSTARSTTRRCSPKPAGSARSSCELAGVAFGDGRGAGPGARRGRRCAARDSSRAATAPA